MNVSVPRMKENDPALELVVALQSMLSPRADPQRKVSVKETQATLPRVAPVEASALICGTCSVGASSFQSQAYCLILFEARRKKAGSG